MIIEVRDKPYLISDGNGGIKWAKIVERTKKPPRVHIVTRKGKTGRFTYNPVEMTLQAFRKLLVGQK